MPRLIALDLGSHAVKASLYRVSGRSQVELEQRYQRFVPQDGAAPSLEHRLAALDALLDESPALKPSSSDVVVLAWPSNEAAFHRIAMPFADRVQIERTLPFAVESEVPFELSDMVLAWRIVESKPQTQVLVALARQAKVAEWIAALGERGLDPAAIHVDADLFGPWGRGVASVIDESSVDAPPDPLVALIDLGHLHTTVSVVRGGAVQVVRSINIGGHAFTRAIAESAGVGWAEAEQLKHGADDVIPDEEPTQSAEAPHSGYTKLPPPVRERLDQVIGMLLAEIRSTLIKAEDTLSGEVAEVRLCGGTARIDELWDRLEADLGVPVRGATDPRGEKSSGPFAVCQALALASTGSAPIDLRVGPLVFRGRTDLLRAALGYGVSGAAIFCVAALLMFAVQMRGLSVEQNEAEAAVRDIVTRSFPEIPATGLDTMTKAQSLMAQFTEDAVHRADVLGDGSVGVPPTIDALYALTQAFPPHPEVTVEVSDLSISPTSITFNAETDGYGSSSKVEEKLKETPRFKAATKGQEQRLNNGRVRFPITIPLGEAATAAAATGTAATPGSGEEG
ncbi:MAG: type II secretion system protein GspL [Myxococcota bacterium]